MRRRAIALLLLAVTATPALADCLLIEPIQVIDVRAGQVLPDQAVIVEGASIRALQAAGSTAVDCSRRIDGEGAYLIPGLAEMHAHVPGQAQHETAVPKVLDLFLANGVTTIRGMLGEPWHLELREQLASGTRRGPRLVTSGPSFNGQSVTSPQQGAEQVREQAAAGYDFLKIHPGLSREEFWAIAQAAREANLPFAGHVSFETGIEAALQAGQASIDHLDSYAEALVPEESALAGVAPNWFGLNLATAMDPRRIPDLARATAAAGVWNVPTQSLFETTAGSMPVEELLSRPGMEMLSEALVSGWVERLNGVRAGASASDRAVFLERRRALIAGLQSAGAGLLLGSDAPQIMNVPGFSVHQELVWLVQAGLTPLQALQSGTLNVARFLGEADRGQVAAGHRADLVLLRDNPLLDINATRNILAVMRDGVWFDREQLDRMLDTVRREGL